MYDIVIHLSSTCQSRLHQAVEDADFNLNSYQATQSKKFYAPDMPVTDFNPAALFLNDLKVNTALRSE